jgi:hypothetical protein
MAQGVRPEFKPQNRKKKKYIYIYMYMYIYVYLCICVYIYMYMYVYILLRRTLPILGHIFSPLANHSVQKDVLI